MKQQRNHHTGQYEAHTITKAVTHIRLEAMNAGKLAALDDLTQAYLPLCQQYVTLFCTDELPDKFRATCFPTPLSERWHRVAIGIARSWRTNRARSYQDYIDDLLDYHERQADGTLDTTQTAEPVWKEWNVPTLQQTCIQASATVVALEPSHDSTFDYWLKISTLVFRKQLLVPVKLADYHRKILAGKAINTSVTLNKRSDECLYACLQSRAHPRSANVLLSGLRPSTSSIAWETMNYAPAKIEKQSKPC